MKKEWKRIYEKVPIGSILYDRYKNKPHWHLESEKDEIATFWKWDYSK